MEGEKNRKYKQYNTLICMDGKLNYCRFVLCKKPHEKRAIRRKIANSVKVLKMAIFSKTAKGGPKEIFEKWPIFKAKFAGQKSRKYKPYNSLISMDGKLNYCRFVLCRKPHEKRAIRREIANSVKGLKMAIFRKTAKRGPREIFQKWPIF